MSFIEILGFALILMIVVMAMTWWLAMKWDNFSVVDPIWGGSFALVTLLYAFLSFDGWGPRRILVLLAVSLWSLRLCFFLGRRIYSHHPNEDERYKNLRLEYGNHVSAGFFKFFQYQGVSVVILSVLFLEMCANGAKKFEMIEIIGLVVMLLSLIGESIADTQANRFKMDPDNRNKTCDVGLWKYSRHPNYFFESCVWWGFYLMALGTPGAAYTVYAPVIILILLLKVTGVPPSEAQALKKRGDAYRAYQKRTSVFVPWFSKSGDS